MKNVITYSGIAAKIRAMQKNLLTKEDFDKLAGCLTTREAAQYLSSLKAYEGLFDNLTENMLHRIPIERRLNLGMYRDFDRLYKFADVHQKYFLNVYFAHFEVRMIKACLLSVMGSNQDIEELKIHSDFISKHANIDICALAESGSLEAFIEQLRETPYYTILHRLYESGTAKLVDYETAIDMRYFNTMWKVKDQAFGKKESGILEKTFGSRIDLLNLNWIYRAKKYYHLTPQEIYGLLIPVRYRLSAEEMKRMVEAENLEAFVEAERGNAYGPQVKQYMQQYQSIGEAMNALAADIYRQTARRNPYSIAPINTYFYLKEQEIQRIVYCIERIHYQDAEIERQVETA